MHTHAHTCTHMHTHPRTHAHALQCPHCRRALPLMHAAGGTRTTCAGAVMAAVRRCHRTLVRLCAPVRTLLVSLHPFLLSHCHGLLSPLPPSSPFPTTMSSCAATRTGLPAPCMCVPAQTLPCWWLPCRSPAPPSPSWLLHSVAWSMLLVCPLYVTLVCHSCMSLLYVTLVCHSCISRLSHLHLSCT